MSETRSAILARQAKRRKAIYARWKKGERVVDIAADEGITRARVYAIMNRCDRKKSDEQKKTGHRPGQ